MSEHEAFLRRFHARHPGITAAAFERGGSYDRLAALVPAEARVLDLACGDGPLLARLGPRAVGVDLSREELARGRPRMVQGRAQALPFAGGAFDVVTCHLAFMLFDEIEHVVAEVGRVLAPGGQLLAILGGGPTARGPTDTGNAEDAFHRFLSVLGAHTASLPATRFGDPRAKTEAGWRQLFAGWAVADFERWELDLGGSIDEVWRFLGASYEVPAGSEDVLRAELVRATADLAGPDGAIPCRVVTWLARAHLPGPAGVSEIRVDGR